MALKERRSGKWQLSLDLGSFFSPTSLQELFDSVLAVAFGVNLHSRAGGETIGSGTFAGTETPFVHVILSAAELARITTLRGLFKVAGPDSVSVLVRG